MKKYGRILGTVALVDVLLWRIDWAQVGTAFGHLNVWLWAAALGTYLFAQVISVVRWYMLARMLGLGGSGGQYLSYYFTGMFFNLALPTSVGGDVVRVWYLSRQTGPSPASGRRSAAFLSVFADRVNGLAVLIALACAAALLCPLPLPGWILGTVAAMGCGTIAGRDRLLHLAHCAAHARTPRLVDDGAAGDLAGGLLGGLGISHGLSNGTC